MPELSPREKEVARQLINGRCNAQAAYNLGVAERTIRFHTDNLKRKFGARTLVHLVVLIIDQKIQEGTYERPDPVGKG